MASFSEEFVTKYTKDMRHMFGLGTMIFKNSYTDAYIDFGEISLNPHKLAVLTMDLLSLSKTKSNASNAKVFMDCIHDSLKNNDMTFIMEIHPEDAPDNMEVVIEYKNDDELKVLNVGNEYVISNCAFSFLLVPNHIVAELPVELMLLIRVLQALTIKVLSESYEDRCILFSYYTNDTLELVSKSIPFSYYIANLYMLAPEERYSFYVHSLKFWFRNFSETASKTKDCTIKKMLLEIDSYMKYLCQESKNSTTAKLYKAQI